MVKLEATNVWKSLGGRLVLRGVSLAVEAGERVVVLGDNGSGKSTLLHVLSGVLDADEGQVTNTCASLGFAPEKPDQPTHLLVGEWLDVVASLKGLRDTRVAPELGIDELRRKKLAALSLGQRQRVSLATAWLGEPDVLVFDEPTNALDAKARDAVLEHLLHTTVLLATHDLEVAERIATRVVRVDRGALA
jgi:ABC-type multidrug transport system ATPase subunit